MAPPTTAEQSFRANLSQFRWARGVNDDSQQTAPPTPSGNPFSRFYNAMGDYVPLRSSERSNEEEAWFALSRWERLLGFGGCLVGAAVCFFVAFLTLPFLFLPGRPRKFALAFSLGSMLVMFGFSVLIGPINHVKHLITAERLPFTLVYFSSLGLTIYFAVGLHSYLGSLVCSVIQILALVSYVLAYFPGGTATLRLAGSTAFRSASRLLPR
ncbi:Protein transport protein SFT2 [Mycena indigotica]|uniref:Protein transport protein SFT2 n=1 Tax=Mycena indigotica TaxID=2126181 RepID=A0A8H6SFZ2_9AGAR|nr:Protein transport protein SFT2 [Mycena indigotica]KAF7297145.1 Protein transport protein SFT2 [Mycena indigotica]